VQFLTIYVREAHPSDGWRMESNDRAGVCFAQPRTTPERIAVATKCCQALKITMPLLIDKIDDRVGHLYSGMPDRLYVVGKDGRVVYKAGRGPFGFNPGEMEQALILHLLDRPAPKKVGRVPLLEDGAAWKRLPCLGRDRGKPLPSWARALAGPLPRTTAALLELDHLHRAASPLDAKLRARVRWVAARANGCAYTQAAALADLRRAGATAAEVKALQAGDQGKLPAQERAALAFAQKLTLAADSVSDEEVKSLRARYGDGNVVALVQLLAYANFQDRLVLSLGLPAEPGGPLAPLEVRLDRRGASAPPPRKALAGKSGARKSALPPGWDGVDFPSLQKEMERQRARPPRIRVPTWEEVKKQLPAGTPVPPRPLRINWSLVCAGYQPRLALAWGACTRAFAEEAKQDRVFEESLFWVVTRSLNCFY
jgi:alkylhydroperoxidase family enzyme